ncbi:MAG TPA: CCA tRNA nucleotidyltransferase [Candidatus Nanoarchaeia archaeon]|nr:CCA tRNA nucleotidyltransferase [Candidatus Nanoarchaeia archaeon]
MTLAAVLKDAKELAVPTADETKRVNSLVKEVISKVSREISRQRLSAKIVVGGSVAKGTWLPGVSDMDFFIIFNYSKFSGKSKTLSNVAEPVLLKAFRKADKLHGSRDYFSVDYKGYALEFVPVLDISKGKEAKNITDFSPLHVSWVQKHAKKKDDIRLVKQFMKAAKVYGAESYIAGFSGHVVDILVAHYGGFEKLLKAAKKWRDNEFIDPAKHYRNKGESLKVLNASKIAGPMILIDPIEKNRNAAAALGKENYDKFRKVAKKFLKNPNLDFFDEKFVTVEYLKERAGKRSLIVFEIKTPSGKPDIVGARMKHIFELLEKNFLAEDFSPKEIGWEFNNTAMFWFYFDKKPLSKTKLHWGPPAKLAEEHIAGFKKAWKGHKITKKKGRYAVEIKRQYLLPKELAKALAKEFKLNLISS